MRRKVSDKVRDLKVAEATAVVAQVSAANRDESIFEVGMFMGAASTLQAISDTAGAKAIRALQHIRDAKTYEQLGYTRFNDFLNNHPRSPMGYDKFNERERVLTLEGEAAYATLNEMGVPISKRKLLSPGSVEVEGDAIIVGEERIPVSDRPRVLAAIRVLADKTTEQARTIERGKKDVEKWKRKTDEAERHSTRALLDSTPHDQALNIALVALGGLRVEAAGLSLAEAAAQRDNAMRMITTLFADIRDAYRYGEAEGGGTVADVSDEDLDEVFS